MTSFERDGKVSLWLFHKAVDAADAEKDVLKDLCGVSYYDTDFQEGNFCEEPTDVNALIGPLSYSESFIEAALSTAERLHIKDAFGVIAQFNFEYEPSKVNKPISEDPAFLGAFNWHED